MLSHSDQEHHWWTEAKQQSRRGTPCRDSLEDDAYRGRFRRDVMAGTELSICQIHGDRLADHRILRTSVQANTRCEELVQIARL